MGPVSTSVEVQRNIDRDTPSVVISYIIIIDIENKITKEE